MEGPTRKEKEEEKKVKRVKEVDLVWILMSHLDGSMESLNIKNTYKISTALSKNLIIFV